MRDIPGWVGGALGVGALVGAFYLGGRMGATPATTDGSSWSQRPEAVSAPAAAPISGLQVQCEPGQRAIVSAAAADNVPTVTCVSDARPVDARVVRSSGTSVAPAFAADVAALYEPAAARPAVLTGPTEVYRPRPRAVSYERRGEAAPARRTWERSAVIIGSSAAVGATVGGLTKGKRGALIGGIVGGGAATVWDQVTRRRTGEVYRR